MTAQQTLAEYKKNEELNFHAENYLLLAEFFKDENATYWAKRYLGVVKNEINYFRNNIRENAHSACNHFYYKLVDLCK